MEIRVLAYGAGIQSTALAMMGCENALLDKTHPLVPFTECFR